MFNLPSPKPTGQNNYCQEVVREGKKNFICTYPDCGKIFRFKSEFQRHKVIHIVSRPFVCPHEGCGKTFKREDALKNHVRIHTGELPFKCEMPGCGLRFPTKAGLRYHLLKHKGDRVCVCTYPGCNKSFLTMAQLRQHENANNYHKKVGTQSTTDNYETQSVFDVVEKDKDVFMNEFFAPELKLAENIEWGMKNQFDYDNQEPVGDGIQENFEKMVKAILKENTRLKQRLDMCGKLMNLMQENQDLKQKIDRVSTNPEPITNNSEDQIFSFLNFDDKMF